MRQRFINILKKTSHWGYAITAAMLVTQANAQHGSLAGAWLMDSRGSWEGLAATKPAQEVLAAFDRSTDDPSMRCVAPALIRTAESQPPIEIIEQDDQILIIYESFNVVRRVQMNGRMPPEWWPLSPIGYSVGVWQGNELVVETTHLIPHLLKDDGFPFSGGSEARIVERYRSSGDRLEIDFDVEDAVNLQGGAATRTFTYDRMTDSMFLHYSCDPLDATGWRLPATGDSPRDLLRWLDLRPPIPE